MWDAAARTRRSPPACRASCSGCRRRPSPARPRPRAPPPLAPECGALLLEGAREAAEEYEEEDYIRDWEVFKTNVELCFVLSQNYCQLCCYR